MKQKEFIIKQLTAMGFEPDELGDVGCIFKYEDLTYLYMSDEDDEQFLRIAVPNLFDVTADNREAVLDAMHDATLVLKYSKVCIMYDTAVWAIYEHYLTAHDNVSDLLAHIICSLQATAHVFRAKINGEDVLSQIKALAAASEDGVEAELEALLNDEE